MLKINILREFVFIKIGFILWCWTVHESNSFTLPPNYSQKSSPSNELKEDFYDADLSYRLITNGKDLIENENTTVDFLNYLDKNDNYTKESVQEQPLKSSANLNYAKENTNIKGAKSKMESKISNLPVIYDFVSHSTNTKTFDEEAASTIAIPTSKRPYFNDTEAVYSNKISTKNPLDFETTNTTLANIAKEMIYTSDLLVNQQTFYSTILNPYFNMDLVKNGFEPFQIVNENRKENIETENINENEDSNDNTDYDNLNNDVDTIPWSEHKYFSLSEMKLLKKYIVTMKRKMFKRGQEKNEKKIREESEDYFEESMGVDRKGKVEGRKGEDGFEEKTVSKLIKELWVLHSHQPNLLTHTYQIKTQKKKINESTEGEKDKVENLKNSLDEIVSSKHIKHNKSFDEINSHGLTGAEIKEEKQYEMDELIKVSDIYSLMQPIGHHFYTDHEINLLDEIFKSFFSDKDGSNYLNNMREIVPILVEKFQHIHKYPYEFHTKNLNIRWLLKSPRIWTINVLMPLVKSLNALKLKSDDLDVLAKHFYASQHPIESEEAKKFIMERQSASQLQALNDKLDQVTEAYPQLDSLIHKQFDVMNYLTDTQMMNLKRYKRMVNETKDFGDDSDGSSEDKYFNNWVDDNDYRDDKGYREYEGYTEVYDEDDADSYDDDNDLEGSESKGSINDKKDDRVDNNFGKLYPEANSKDNDDENKNGKDINTKNDFGDNSNGENDFDDGGENDDEDDDEDEEDNIIKDIYGKNVDVEHRTNDERKKSRKYKRGENTTDNVYMAEDNEADLSLKGRRISAEMLYENMEMIKENSQVLLEKEKKLMDFFNFKNINRFFERFDFTGERKADINSDKAFGNDL